MFAIEVVLLQNADYDSVCHCKRFDTFEDAARALQKYLSPTVTACFADDDDDDDEHKVPLTVLSARIFRTSSHEFQRIIEHHTGRAAAAPAVTMDR